MLHTSSQFLSSEQPSEPKSLDVALNIAGVENIRSKNLRLRSTRRSFDSSFERKRGPVTVEICVPCGRRFSNQFVFILMFDVSQFPTSISVSTIILKLRKVEFIK